MDGGNLSVREQSRSLVRGVLVKGKDESGPVDQTGVWGGRGKSRYGRLPAPYALAGVLLCVGVFCVCGEWVGVCVWPDFGLCAHS